MAFNVCPCFNITKRAFDMSASILFSFILYSFVTSVTPGPNNVMLTASGLNFGFRRSVPHILGIGFGFGFMVAVVGLGLGHSFPDLNFYMKPSA